MAYNPKNQPVTGDYKGYSSKKFGLSLVVHVHVFCIFIIYGTFHGGIGNYALLDGFNANPCAGKCHTREPEGRCKVASSHPLTSLG